MQKNLWKGLFRPENKKLRSNIFLALLAGVLLLAMGKGFFGGEKETPAQAETQTASDVAERETETRMAEILSKVQGAGAVDVMLTYCRTEERTIAQDEVREESERDGKFRVEQKTVLTEEKGGNTAPFILSENAPVIEGVVIVAEGGGDATVQTALQLTEEGDVTALVDYSALPDDTDETELDPITAETTGDGAAVYVSANGNGSAYFAEAKLNREQSRAKEKDILTEMLNNENITEEQKAKCTESMLLLQERMEKESAAEAMIQSKGFKQAYVRMDNETVDVVVDAVKLTDKDVAQIEDIVQRKTGMPADKIRINTLQK